MKISLNWLKSYIDLDGISVEEISRAVTFLNFEVEQVIRTGAPQVNQVYVGQILTRGKHPNADKLSVCTVDVGPSGGVKTIVCGASNCDAGNRVPVALPGAILPGNFEIKLSTIRGHASDGMMCSAKELAVSDEGAGLLILPADAPIGAPINSVLPAGDTVIDIEITPNRPDCLCHLGIARELAAWFRKDLKYPEVTFTPAKVGAARPQILNTVAVADPVLCPLYTATVITGVKIGPSPDWMQARLAAVGLRPINNIVDISNYVMLEYGQPTHAFDAATLAGGTLQVRNANDGEKLVTLDGRERSLTTDMLVIADAEKPLVVAGVMGGISSGVSATTTEIVLEAAVFKRQSVRATSRKLGLSSDSSYRYERGVDSHGLEEAAHRAIDLILQYAGGTVAGSTLRQGGEAPWQREIVITPAFVNEKLGFEIPVADMRSALEGLELTITREEATATRGDAWTVAIPSWRDDLDRPIDLVEEILRVYGTERIPTSRVTAPGLVGNDDPIVLFNRAVSERLVGQGFHECVNYTLRGKKEIEAWMGNSSIDALALANPFVEDQSHLRPTLISGLLETVRLNQARGVSVSKLFETGRIFLERKGQIVECIAVGFVCVEEEADRSWLKRTPADFYSIKGILDVIAGPAGVEFSRQPLSAVTESAAGWQAGHAATAGDISFGWMGRLGLVSLALTKELGIEGKVQAGLFAILPEKLTAGAARRSFKPFPLVPSALRDLALIVDADTPAAEVQKAVAKAAREAVGNLFALETVNVFDVYRGQGLPEGKKSLGFSLVFRSAERTLTDDEVNVVFTKLQEDLSRNGYQIRK